MYAMNGKIYRFETLPSTQDFLREKQGEGRDMLAVAKTQTGGKGTKGRTFECALGGLWLSLLRFHENVPAKDAFLMMAKAAVAVAKTLEEYGLSPKIKWANDVLVGGKKICGILTENRLSPSGIVSTLWGIGLNVNNRLSDGLSTLATSMSEQLCKAFDLGEIEEKLLGHLSEDFAFTEYQTRLAYVGERVEFTTNGAPFFARLDGVTERGELLLSANGEQKAYAYGEIALAKKERI
jgi:BirA family biotin operon repressor/biotin-[acetyl-CoA-carboxylase] ligase